jgi:stage III sporulation protein AG
MDLKSLFQNKWLIVLGLIGLLCLLFGSFYNRSGSPAVTTTANGAGQSAAGNAQQAGAAVHNISNSNPAQAFESQYEGQLTAMLKQMTGIHSVSVMVTMDSTEGLNLANNTKTTQQVQSGPNQSTSKTETSSEDIFTEHNSDGTTGPIVVQRTTPKVRGVLVLVNADDFYIAKSEIVDAIQNVLDVPAYKISVEPQKSNS